MSGDYTILCWRRPTSVKGVASLLNASYLRGVETERSRSRCNAECLNKKEQKE
jgi:hypothetical protein